MVFNKHCGCPSVSGSSTDPGMGRIVPNIENQQWLRSSHGARLRPGSPVYTFSLRPRQERHVSSSVPRVWVFCTTSKSPVLCVPPRCPATWLTSDTVFLEVVSPLPRCRPQMPVAGVGPPGCPHFCLTRLQIRASGDPSSGSSFARTARRTQRHASTRLPGAGASVLWVAGHPFPARKFSEPQASGMFMEASSRRHHRFLAPSPARRPSPKVGSWGWKF